MFNHSKNLVYSNFIIALTVCLTPMLSLLIKGWASTCLFIAFAISFISLIGKDFPSTLLFLKSLKKDKSLIFLVMIPLILPIVVVFLTSALKGNLSFRIFDGPSRYIFALIILIYLVKNKIQIQEKFIFGILLMPIVTLLLIDFTEKKEWSVEIQRLTVYFIDPIVFGSICLTFSSLALVTFFSRNKSITVTILSLIGFVCGSYLSILSGSRTGWLAFPFIIFIILRYEINLNSLKSFLLTGIITVSLSFSLFNLSGTVNNRISSMISDINDYQWNDVNKNTSGGERISFIRMGWYYMTLRPLTGWNGLDYLVHKDDLAVAKYASLDTRLGVKGGGFHNEFINNGVKYGFFGLLFSLFLVILPAIFFIKKLSNNQKNISAILGLALSIMYFFSSLTYQVLDFKFTISLYSILLITLVASSLQNETTSSFFVSKT